MGARVSELADLYEAEVQAYRQYQVVETGQDLVGFQRVSPVRVEQAREVWLHALRMYVNAGGTYETTRDIIAAKVAEAE